MKTILALSVAVSVASAQLLEPYTQCGGLDWKYNWQCSAGHTCKPVGTDNFPRYQCLPDGGGNWGVSFQWGQCGGLSWTGPTRCVPGWECIYRNQWFSTCAALPGTVDSPNPTPELANPGAWCGSSAITRGLPSECVPGYVCTGPGVFGYYVCLLEQTTTSTTALPTPTTLSTVVIPTTTVVIPTTSSVSTTKVKTTTTKKSTTTKSKTTKTTTTAKATKTAVVTPTP